MPHPESAIGTSYVLTLMYMMSVDDMIITGYKGSIITLSPQYLYIPDGSQDIVRCQNRSDDGETFYSYIITAVWYRYMMMERMSSLIALGQFIPDYTH